MKHYILFLTLFLLFPLTSHADRNNEQQVILQKKNGHGGHGGYVIADWPDAVYYDSDEMEIIIEADGVSSYYYIVGFNKL